jgi:hypothetical protein
VNIIMLMNKITEILVGADLSRTPPIHRPFRGFHNTPFNLLMFIIVPYDSSEGMETTQLNEITTMYKIVR